MQPGRNLVLELVGKDSIGIEEMNTKLLLIPYAYGGNTGLNIQNPKKQFDIYMKNCCVACLSSKLR